MAPATTGTVLLVEDNDTARLTFEKMLREFLVQHRYQLLTADTATSALAFLGFFRPHLLVLDPGLPDMDGREVLRALNGDPQEPAVPTIVVSANPFAATAGDGVVAVLRKPIRRGDLVDAVTLALGLERVAD